MSYRPCAVFPEDILAITFWSKSEICIYDTFRFAAIHANPTAINVRNLLKHLAVPKEVYDQGLDLYKNGTLK